MKNSRHIKFCVAYIEHGNATQAYIDAGYKASNRTVATENANRLLKREDIQEYLKKLRKEVAKENKWTISKLINKFEDIVERIIRDNEEEGRRFDASGAVKAYENIGKLCGFYEEKVKHSGDVVTRINVIPARKKKNEWC